MRNVLKQRNIYNKVHNITSTVIITQAYITCRLARFTDYTFHIILLLQDLFLVKIRMPLLRVPLWVRFSFVSVDDASWAYEVFEPQALVGFG